MEFNDLIWKEGRGVSLPLVARARRLGRKEGHRWYAISPSDTRLLTDKADTPLSIAHHCAISVTAEEKLI